MSEEINDQSICKNNFEIDFDEDTHTYYVNGVRKPSVSAIMRPISDKHYNDMNVPKSVIEKAAKRGTLVHEAIDLYDTFGVETENKEIKPYLLGYKMAKRLEVLFPKYNEIRLTNGDYCGTLDMIAIKDNELILIDLKATSKINYELLEVQLCAYKELANFNGHSIDKTYCLHIKPNNYKLVKIEPNVALWEELKKEWREKHEN